MHVAEGGGLGLERLFEGVAHVRRADVGLGRIGRQGTPQPSGQCFVTGLASDIYERVRLSGIHTNFPYERRNCLV